MPNLCFLGCLQLIFGFPFFETELNVRTKKWYWQLLTQTIRKINELAVKDLFKESVGTKIKIKLVGIEGDVERCAATRAEWTALIEDLDRAAMMDQIQHRPQNQRLPFGDLIEGLEWLAKSDDNRHIIIASCPRSHFLEALDLAAHYDNVHFSVVIDHEKQAFDEIFPRPSMRCSLARPA